MAKVAQIIAKISRGINHDSTVAVSELLTNVTGNNVEFILDQINKLNTGISSIFIL